MSLNFEATNRPQRLGETELRLVGIFSDGKPAATAMKIDQSGQELFAAIRDGGLFEGKAGQSHLHTMSASTAWLLVGLGDGSGRGRSRRVSEGDWRRVITMLGATIDTLPYGQIGTDLVSVHPASLSLDSATTQFLEAIGNAHYRFRLHPGRNKPEGAADRHVVVYASGLKDLKTALKRGTALIDGMDLARDLGNLAPNRCTPVYLAAEAERLAADNESMTIEILDEEQMGELGMQAFLAVSRGSAEPGRMIAMQWRGAPERKGSHVIVGKGVTFDTGGISIKPSAAMDEMKYDMCGAAAVFGVMRAVRDLELPINVTGVVAAAENMPDGNATKPGDVVESLSGQSIEILNTDAEGRLVLADALTWIEKFEPVEVVDIATLTGACIVALGHVASAVLGNDETLVDALREAGEASGDRTWALPLWDEYDRQLDSRFADMGNIGGPPAGTITAACFLQRFARDYAWAHLDIAGIAWKKGKEKGATGRPVPLLLHYLLTHAGPQYETAAPSSQRPASGKRSSTSEKPSSASGTGKRSRSGRKSDNARGSKRS